MDRPESVECGTLKLRRWASTAPSWMSIHSQSVPVITAVQWHLETLLTTVTIVSNGMVEYLLMRDSAVAPAALTSASDSVSCADTTDHQLARLFAKCLTPGAEIVLAAVGGSITAAYGYPNAPGFNNIYINRLAEFVQQLCPMATVRAVNAARPATGSVLPSLCLRDLVGQTMDLLAIEYRCEQKPMQTSKTTVDACGRGSLPRCKWIDALAIIL